MGRLITSKSASEMGMFELAHNSCYVKDGKAMYRDYDRDVDLRQLTIELFNKLADIPNEFTCDEDFDDFIEISLQYGADNILGLIALFYRNSWAMADLYERLKYYEDLEELCETKKKAYSIYMDCPKNYKPEYCTDHEGSCDKCHHRVPIITNTTFSVHCIKELGKSIFLTQAEAEAALERMEKEAEYE